VEGAERDSRSYGDESAPPSSSSAAAAPPPASSSSSSSGAAPDDRSNGRGGGSREREDRDHRPRDRSRSPQGDRGDRKDVDGSAGGRRLYVNAPGVREGEMREAFASFGRVGDISIKGDFAFVEFDDPRAADEAARGLNGKELHGTRWRVEEARGNPGQKKGSKCFICNGVGHWARDCPQANNSDRTRCFNCGDAGHMARNCRGSRRRSRSRSRSPRDRRDRRSPPRRSSRDRR